jgi:hypothetical protein
LVFQPGIRPFLARRVNWRRFPLLEDRAAITPPPVPVLPALSESLPASVWGRQERWSQIPIDPDAIN